MANLTEPLPKTAAQVAQEVWQTSEDMMNNVKKLAMKGVIQFWHSDPEPQDIADVLGSRVGTIFAKHADLVGKIADVDPAYANQIIAKIGTYVLNEDGTVSQCQRPAQELES